MVRYPVEIRRCTHIKTSGAQCGSPSLKDKEFCYYHQENRTVPAEIYLDGETYCDHVMMLPPLEDAHAIQTMLQHVQLMLQHRIDRKDAGLMLYALQIASGNLKQMQAEKPGPTQMVREPEKVGETPMGRTPWSAAGSGHDPDLSKEEAEDLEGIDIAKWPKGYKPSADDLFYCLSSKQRTAMRADFFEKGHITNEEFEGYLEFGRMDPLLRTLRRLCAQRAQKEREEKERAAMPEPTEAEDAEVEEGKNRGSRRSRMTRRCGRTTGEGRRAVP